MATPSFDDLTKPVTKEEFETAIYDVLAAVGVTTTTWLVGSVVRTIVTAVAIVAASISLLVAELTKAGFLDLTTGRWLELVALHVYGVTKQTDSFATGTMVVDNTSGNLYSGAAGGLTFLNPTTGKTYRNTQAFSVSPNSTGTEIPIKAVEAGSASTSPPNTITQLESPLTGVTVTNPDAVVGEDAESDASLRAKCRAKLGSLSPNGAKDAYRFIAVTAKRTDGSGLGITRTSKPLHDGFGGVTVWVATASGGVTGDVNDPSTDLGRLFELLDEQVVPLPITLTLASATTKTLDITYDVWVTSSITATDAELQSDITDAITAYLAQQPIGGNVAGVGGFIFLEILKAVIRSVDSTHIFHVEITTPSGDFALSNNEVAIPGNIVADSITRV